MKSYSVHEFRQNMKTVLDSAQNEPVSIRHRDGRLFTLRLEHPCAEQSPFDALDAIDFSDIPAWKPGELTSVEAVRLGRDEDRYG